MLIKNRQMMFLISRAAVKIPVGNRCSSLYSAEFVLSEDNIRRTVARFAAMKPIRFNTQIPAKKAAVLIPICVVDDKVSLLYTLRATNLKSHRGQVSFPGGMQDPTDKTLEETALRECNEELGIEPGTIRVWGSGNTIISRTETSVLPVIGHIKNKIDVNKIQINPKEVEEVFTVPLEELCSPVNIGHTQFRGAFSMPVFLGGKRRIWGLTALITNIFLSSLLPQQAYTHKIKFIPPVHVKYDGLYK